MFLLQVVTKLWPNFIICKFRPRVKLWESRCTPRHQPIAKKFRGIIFYQNETL